jgi:hypothetical protein
MSQVKKKISAIDKVDVAVVVVGPSAGPRLRDFKVVAAVGKMRPAFDDRYVPDGEVMIVSEVLTEMRVIDPAHMLVVPRFFVMLFLLGIAMLVSVFILGHGGHRRPQNKGSTDPSDYCQSLHE